MNKRSISFRALALIVAIWCSGISLGFGEGAPNIVWEVPTPSGLANSIVGVGWAPGSRWAGRDGLDRSLVAHAPGWSGALSYSILGPQHSRGGDQTIYSTDGLYLAVHNLNKGLDYRVYRATDGFFLGTIVVTTDSNGVIQFTPDIQLQAWGA